MLGLHFLIGFVWTFGTLCVTSCTRVCCLLIRVCVLIIWCRCLLVVTVAELLDFVLNCWSWVCCWTCVKYFALFNYRTWFNHFTGGRHCETSGRVRVHMETHAPEPLFAQAHSAQTGSVINELCVSRFNPSIIFLVTTLRRDWGVINAWRTCD